jgi:hypothetical protein
MFEECQQSGTKQFTLPPQPRLLQHQRFHRMRGKLMDEGIGLHGDWLFEAGLDNIGLAEGVFGMNARDRPLRGARDDKEVTV